LRHVEHIVRVQPKGIVAGGMRESRVSRGRKIVDPYEVGDARAKFSGNLLCAVDAAGIDDDDLVEEAANRFQAACQIALLVAHNHCETDLGLASRAAGHWKAPPWSSLLGRCPGRLFDGWALRRCEKYGRSDRI